MRWVWNVARIRERRNVNRSLVGNLMERDNLGDLGVDRRIVLKQLFKKFGGEALGL